MKRYVLGFFILLMPYYTFAQTYLPQFDSVLDAHQHCPNDSIVWINTSSAAPRYRLQPKSPQHGGYVCRQEAINAGLGGMVTHLQPVR